MTLPEYLNVGCGTDVRENWCNIDLRKMGNMMEGRDFFFDIAGPHYKFPAQLYGEGYFKHIEASHIIEHVKDDLLFMENLWILAKPGATLLIKCPHGGSDEAWQDPTHVREVTEARFQYYDQRTYWMQDTNYRGDWELEQVTLYTAGIDIDAVGHEKAYSITRHGRNFVKEMHAVLVARKPAWTWPDGERSPQKIMLNIELRSV